MIHYYDRHGNKISVDQYTSLVVDDEYKIVCQDRVSGFFISTIWLGIDHGWYSSGKKMLFQSMIFKGDTWVDLYCERYETEEEASRGHVKALYKCLTGSLNDR